MPEHSSIVLIVLNTVNANVNYNGWALPPACLTSVYLKIHTW